MKKAIIVTDFIARWVEDEDEGPTPQAAIAFILSRRPGDWAVVEELIVENENDPYWTDNGAVFACQHEPRIMTRLCLNPLDDGRHRYEMRARWIPDDEWADQQAAVKQAAAFNELARLLREALHP